MSKTSDLDQLRRGALKEIAQWLVLQGRIDDDFKGWLKADFVAVLGRKLDSDKINRLVRKARDEKPFFTANALADVLGLPQKERMLEIATKSDLRKVIEKMEMDREIVVPWRSMNMGQLRDYVRSKLSKEEVADFLWPALFGQRLGKAHRPEGPNEDHRTEVTTDSTQDEPAPSSTDVLRMIFLGEPGGASSTKTPAKRKRPAKAATAKTGLLASRYQLDRFLAEGGFATTYEATDTRDPGFGRVVIKFPKNSDAAYVNALEKEFGLAMQLSHPNICRYLDSGSSDGHLFVVMQHCGASISDIMDTEAALDIDRAIDIVCQVADGLDYAHEQDIVHLDINPGNVLVQQGRRREIVRITDFGVSAAGTRTMTTGGRSTVMAPLSGGHPGYAAPEASHIGGRGRRRSDQFSLGKLFCSMLEGTVFDAPYAVWEFARLTAEQNAAVKKACAYEPGKRFTSCGAFAAALREGGI